MTFESQVNPNTIIIDDSNYQEYAIDPVVNGELKSRGRKPRDWDRHPYGSVAAPFDLPLIPDDEWLDRIKEQEATKSRLSDLLDLVDLGVMDQARTNFCWDFATTHTVETIRVKQNNKLVRLSPASTACKITNFRNNGGWGSEALEYIIEHGCVPQEDWPQAAIDRRYDTPEAWEKAKRYKVTEWWDIEPRNFEQVATCLLLGIPVSAGYDWWGHQVMLLDLIYKNGEFGALIDNSWGTGWGDNGRGILMRNKATPDDACAPRVAMAA